jgi:hypothetical protein
MNVVPCVLATASFCLCQSICAQTGPAGAQQICSPSTLDLLGKHFGISDLSYPQSARTSDAENRGVIVAGACKAWPNDKSQTIAIVAYDAGVEHEKALLVALVDTSRAVVLASYRGAMQEDAAMTVGADSFWIDTARYDLAPGVRAFGFDATTSYSQGCVDGGLGPIRTLFVRDGKAIRPVLEGFYMSTWTFVEGGPSCASGDREIVTETIAYAIGVGKAARKGLSNLRITATSSFSNGAKPTRKPLQYDLQYDGEKYPTTTTFNGAAGKIDRWHQ